MDWTRNPQKTILRFDEKGWGKMDNVLWAKGFYQFLVGRFLSRVGDKLFLVALPLLVEKMGYGAVLISLSSVLQYMANFIGGSLGGYLADRYNRKHLMLAVSLVQMASIVGVILSLTNKHVFLFVFLVSVFLLHLSGMVNRVNRFSMTSLFSGQGGISKANAEIQVMESSARIVGPLVAGIVIAKLNISFALWMDALTFLVMFLVVTQFVRLDAIKAPKRQQFKLFHVPRILREDPSLKWYTLVYVLVTPVFSFVGAFNVYYMSEQVHLQGTGIGLTLTLTAVLSLVFGLILRKFHKEFATRSTLSIICALVGVLMGILLFALTHRWLLFFTGYTVYVLGMELFNQQFNTLLQEKTPTELHGRVFSFSTNISNIIAPITLVIGGLLSNSANLGPIFCYTSALILVALVIFVVSRQRSLDTTYSNTEEVVK